MTYRSNDGGTRIQKIAVHVQYNEYNEAVPTHENPKADTVANKGVEGRRPADHRKWEVK